MIKQWNRRLAFIAVLITVVGGVAATALAAGRFSAPERLDTRSEGLVRSDVVACASSTLCFGGDQGLDVDAYHLSANPASDSVLGFGLTIPFGSGDNSVTPLSLQCPSSTLCAAVADYDSDEDDTLDAVVSTTPAAGPSSWIEQNLDDPPVQLSCPTATLCAGAAQSGHITTSQDPGGGAAAWQSTELAATIVDVDCASAMFCVAVDSTGDVWTSTDPTGGPNAWNRSAAAEPLAAAAKVDADASGGIVPENLACTGPELCVAVGTGGDVLVSTDPAGAAAWTPVGVSGAAIDAVDCPPGGSLCLAGDAQGDIATSDDGAGTSWSAVQTPDSGAISDITCAGGRCLAVLAGPSVPLTATVPASGGAWQWSPVDIRTDEPLSAVACPTRSDCISTGSVDFYASADPAAGLRSWHARVQDDEFGDHGAGTLDAACYSAGGCFAVADDVASGGLADVSGGDLIRFDPRGGAHAFHDTGLGGGNDIRFVACAQGTCVAGFPGYWFQTSDPAGNRGWRKLAHPRFDVTCLHANAACVALANGPFPGTAGPDLLVAAHRSGPWRTEDIDPGGQITGLACTSAGACLVVDAAGKLLLATHPTAGPAAWRPIDSDPVGFNGVACQDARTCLAVDNDGRVVVGRP